MDKINKIRKVLDIPKKELIDAMTMDYRNKLKELVGVVDPYENEDELIGPSDWTGIHYENE